MRRQFEEKRRILAGQIYFARSGLNNIGVPARFVRPPQVRRQFEEKRRILAGQIYFARSGLNNIGVPARFVRPPQVRRQFEEKRKILAGQIHFARSGLNNIGVPARFVRGEQSKIIFGGKNRMKGIFEWIKKHKRIVVIVSIVAVVAVILRGCFGGADSSNIAANYDLTNPQKRDISVIVGGTGVLQPSNSRTIMAAVTGDVLANHFKDGDKVKKGDLILELDPTDANRAISSAEDALAQAAIAVRQAQVGVSNAQLSSSSAGETASDLYISSNFSGQVTAINFSAGDNISAGAIAATVTDSKTALLKLPFNSVDAKNIITGNSAMIYITATGETLSGTVREVSGVETVGIGGILTREITIATENPGGITETTYATARVGEYACASGGSFEYNVSKSIVSYASGKIASVDVFEGDWVTSGQTILTVENSSVSNQAASAGNSLQSAQLSLQNAQLSYESAQRNLEKTREVLDDYEITAPIDGTVAFIGFEAGNYVSAAKMATTPLVEIFDMSTLKFDIYVDELDIGKIHPGQKVAVTADAVIGESFTGEVESVSISGQTTSGVTTYPVTVRISNFGSLLPGMNVSAEIMIEEVKDVLTIPVTAVYRGNTVLVKDDTSEGDANDSVPAGYRRVEVTLGRNDEDYIEVLGGLTESDTIAIDTSTSSLMQNMADMRQD